MELDVQQNEIFEINPHPEIGRGHSMAVLAYGMHDQFVYKVPIHDWMNGCDNRQDPNEYLCHQFEYWQMLRTYLPDYVPNPVFWVDGAIDNKYLPHDARYNAGVVCERVNEYRTIEELSDEEYKDLAPLLIPFIDGAIQMIEETGIWPDYSGNTEGMFTNVIQFRLSRNLVVVGEGAERKLILLDFGTPSRFLEFGPIRKLFNLISLRDLKNERQKLCRHLNDV